MEFCRIGPLRKRSDLQWNVEAALLGIHPRVISSQISYHSFPRGDPSPSFRSCKNEME